jgi:hypothetical protein
MYFGLRCGLLPNLSEGFPRVDPLKLHPLRFVYLYHNRKRLRCRQQRGPKDRSQLSKGFSSAMEGLRYGLSPALGSLGHLAFARYMHRCLWSTEFYGRVRSRESINSVLSSTITLACSSPLNQFFRNLQLLLPHTCNAVTSTG